MAYLNYIRLFAIIQRRNLNDKDNMFWPTICIDNFFNDPEKIVNFSKILPFKKSLNGKWPGERTDNIFDIDKNFFRFFSLKILSVLYPYNYQDFNITLNLCFQKISKEHRVKGWVHSDSYESEITIIVYLSKHKECGTSIFDSKMISSNSINQEKKQEMFLEKKFEDNIKYLEENNKQFEETLSIKSKYNRLLIFDSSQFHAAQNFFESNNNEDRLTLIGFVNNINSLKLRPNGIFHKKII